MKKFYLVLLVLMLGSVALFAAGAKEGVNVDLSNLGNEPVPVRVLAMKGPTAMGMVSLMEEAKKGVMDGNAYTFDDLATIDVVVAKLVKNEVDIAAIPANMSSVLFNNTKGALKVLAINTLGVLYIMESGNTITSIEDLAGKTIFSTGKGASPEYALKYLLNSYGIKDVSQPFRCFHLCRLQVISLIVLFPFVGFVHPHSGEFNQTQLFIWKLSVDKKASLNGRTISFHRIIFQ